MDQDFGFSHYSAPACDIHGQPTDDGYRLTYAAVHGQPLWDWRPPNCGKNGFTNSDVAAGDTGIRTVHVEELRNRIDTRRRHVGLSDFQWTDRTVVAGVTTVRAVHLRELRTALDAAYIAAGRNVPMYTDQMIVALVTPIKAVHLRELHEAVVALEE